MSGAPARAGRALVGLLVLTTAVAAQEREVHGADSVFVSATVSVAWAVLKAPVEQNSVVLMRIVNTTRRYAFVGVEGVDPFTRRRAVIAEGRPLGGELGVRSARGSFEDYPRREIHLYTTEENWLARTSALTVYYLGVPDTTPEFTTESAALTYLAGAFKRA